MCGSHQHLPFLTNYPTLRGMLSVCPMVIVGWIYSRKSLCKTQGAWIVPRIKRMLFTGGAFLVDYLHAGAK